MTKIKLADKIVGCLCFTKVRGYCILCGGRIFNINSRFGKKGMCVNCYIAYEQGRRDRLVQVLNPKDNQWSLIDRITANIIARSETRFKGVAEASPKGAGA
jgi:hypothetical protein